MPAWRKAVIGLRFAVGLAAAVFAGKVAWHAMLDDASPGPRFLYLLAELAWLAVAAGAAAWAVGAREWQILLWVDRAALAGAAWKSWQLHGALKGRWGWLAFLAVVLLIHHHIARRHALGWIIDASGERQKVERWNGGVAIVKPTTRAQRLIEQAGLRHIRRKGLLWSSIVGWPLAYVGHILIQHGQQALGDIAYVASLSAILIVWLPMAIYELLYQIGFQDMKGAKVLDPEPHRPGFDDGASEAEAGGFLNRQGT